MNQEEAKSILEAFDPMLHPIPTPEIEKALACLETDPELQAWYVRQRAFDRQMAAACQANSELMGPPRVPRFSRRQWLGVSGIGIAASLALGYYGFRHRYRYSGPKTPLSAQSPASIDDFTRFAAVYVANGFFLDVATALHTEAHTWFLEKSLPVSDLGQVATLDSVGCKRLAWRETPVSLHCVQDEEEHLLHLLRIPLDLCDMPATTARSLVHLDRKTLRWKNDECVCVLVPHKANQALPAQLA